MPELPDTSADAGLPPQEKKSRLRLVLCDLDDGHLLAQVKLTEAAYIEGNRSLLQSTLAHVLTLLPSAAHE